MPKIKLTDKEKSEYIKLFIEDKTYYTIIDFLKQNKNFSFLKNYSMYIVFIEFLSNIFEIKWDKDVFYNNHNRLLDIIMGIIYAKDIEKDEQSKQIFEEIKENFLTLYNNISTKIRYIYPEDNNIFANKIKNLPNFSKLQKIIKILKKISPAYIMKYKNEIENNNFPDWILSERAGIYIDEQNYEPLRIETQKWTQNLLKKND